MAQSKGLGAALPPSSATHLPLGLASLDAALKGGLLLGALHELSPAAPFHSGAASGFALALAMTRGEGAIVWVQQDFAVLETGALYGCAAALFGLDLSRLILVRAPTPKDVLWSMEEALKTREVAAVIGELAEAGESADLTATRRLSLAAEKGGGLALLLRHRRTTMPSAAATRWDIASAPAAGDAFGGLGGTAFALSLFKNRAGPCGQWVLQWDHHEHQFKSALSVAVATPPADRSGTEGFAHSA